jgi:TRAP-type C4-dicarboxylate transport system permease small subunit
MAESALIDSSGASGPRGPVATLLHTFIRWWAIAGGVIFCAIVVMSVISIVGRKLFASPVEGDMELLMMLAAVGSAAFLPLCELNDYHIRVDAVTTRLPERARATLDVWAHALLAVCAAALAWRTQLYVYELRDSMEVSPILMVPMWVPVLLLVPSFVLLVLAALYRAGRSLCVITTGARP